MTDTARDIARVRNPVLVISAVTWILLLLEPGGLVIFAHCPAMISGAMPMPSSFQTLLAMNPPASLAAGWAVMLFAMMSPALIPPLCHIRLRSFTSRRARSIALFVAGYAAIWMAVGSALLAIELAAKSFAPQSYLPAVSAVLMALVWQFSPIKQRCLNRCHAHTELAAFGAAADFDVLRFGVTHGVWCAGSCWALMLFPMLLPRGHVVAMAAVAVLIFSERLEQPRPLCWRWRGLGKVKRIVIAQARIAFVGQPILAAAAFQAASSPRDNSVSVARDTPSSDRLPLI
jgi:predicted metal-binding membrane protein